MLASASTLQPRPKLAAHRPEQAPRDLLRREGDDGNRGAPNEQRVELSLGVHPDLLGDVAGSCAGSSSGRNAAIGRSGGRSEAPVAAGASLLSMEETPTLRSRGARPPRP